SPGEWPPTGCRSPGPPDLLEPGRALLISRLISIRCRSHPRRSVPHRLHRAPDTVHHRPMHRVERQWNNHAQLAVRVRARLGGSGRLVSRGDFVCYLVNMAGMRMEIRRQNLDLVTTRIIVPNGKYVANHRDTTTSSPSPSPYLLGEISAHVMAIISTYLSQR